MEEWGLTDKGFNRPTQAELKVSVDQYFRESFGDDVNLSPKSPTGILIDLISWLGEKQYELAEKTYHSGHPSEAEGVQLDYLTPFFSTSRNPEQYSAEYIKINGTPFSTIEAGTRYETESGFDVSTTEDVTLDSEGVGRVWSVALTPGVVGNVPAGTIVVQSEPSADVISVTNENAFTGGRDAETTEELRARLLNSGSSIGSGTVNAVVASVLNLPGVRAANVIVNNTDGVVNGQPAHSNQLFVLGGDSQTIADTLMDNFTGIQFYGTTTRTVKDISGNTHTMGYTPASLINIYSSITLTTDSTFESDGVTKVKDAVVRLIGGTASDGTIYSGLSMGDDVIYSRVLSAVVNVQGVVDATLNIGREPNPDETGNIVVNVNEVAQVNAVDITVTA